MPPRRTNLRAQITVSIAYDVRLTLEEIADKRHTPVSRLVEEACRAYFDIQARDFKIVEDKG